MKRFVLSALVVAQLVGALALERPAAAAGIHHGRLANSSRPNWSDLVESARRQDLFVVNPWWVRKKAKIKATRPTDQVIAYFNAAGCKPDSTPLDDGSGRRGQSAMPCSEAKRHERWFLHSCAARVKSCRIRTWWNRPAMNVGNPRYQRAWTADALHNWRFGFDGIFMDDVNMKCNCRTTPVEYPTDAAYQRAVTRFLANTSSRLVANGVARNRIFGNVGYWLSNVTKACRWNRYISMSEEHWTQFGSFAQQRHQITCAQQNGRWFYGRTEGSASHQRRLRYGQGMALLFTRGRAVIGAQDPTNDVWIAAYSQANRLGDPTGAAFRRANGTWRRNFRHGYVVVKPASKRAAITLDAGTRSPLVALPPTWTGCSSPVLSCRAGDA
jgi:hypothetical protein